MWPLDSRDLWPRSQAELAIAGSAVFVTGFALRSLLSVAPTRGITKSPRETLLPSLSESRKLALPYPPDAFPGARDVNSPYGKQRVYEFGPEDGRKVLLVHGISTPCLALGGLAHALVERGCRVMLFDLPGRGYSDTPTDLNHDTRLFISQILVVLASSKLSWIGDGSSYSEHGPGFDIVGYSLGGGISAAFTSYFPALVRTMILIAPSGLIRDHHISRTSRFLYAKTTIFEPILLRIVRGRLKKPVKEPKHDHEQPSPNERADTTKAVRAEINLEGNQQVVLSKAHPEITIEHAVNFQVENHHGFVPAFMSSIRYGPIQHQHEDWRRIGQELAKDQGTALIILGERDPIINCHEIQADASDVLAGRVKFVIMDAGHEAPVAKGPEVAGHIWEFWCTN